MTAGNQKRSTSSEVVHQADAGPARRKNVPSKVVGSKTIDGRKNVLALAVQCT
jgi:hypothetical protein